MGSEHVGWERREVTEFVMPLTPVRPDLGQLVLRVFDSTLHPEFFECYRTVVFRNGPFAVTVRLCAAGHVVGSTCDGRFVTEALTVREQPLPGKHRRLEQRLKGCRTQALVLPNGWRYDVSCQVEQVDWDVYSQVHEELLADAMRADLAYIFPMATRLDPAALSVVQLEFMPRGVLVHAFHTYPEHRAIVKTQSLFEHGD